MIFEILNAALAMAALGVIGYGLWQVAKAAISAYEHHKWIERCDKYNRWLNAFKKDNEHNLSEEERAIFRQHLQDILDGGNKDMRGPWEELE